MVHSLLPTTGTNLMAPRAENVSAVYPRYGLLSSVSTSHSTSLERPSFFIVFIRSPLSLLFPLSLFPPLLTKLRISKPEAGADSKAFNDQRHVFHTESMMSRLDTSRNGITSSEAKTRVETCGPSQLTEKKRKSLLRRIWEQVNNVLVAILVFIAVFSSAKAATAKDT